MDEPITPEVVADKGPENQPVTPPLFEKIGKYCDDLFEKFSTSPYRKKQIELIEESHRIYAQESEETDFPFEGAVNNVLPLTAITIDNMEPRLVAGLIGKAPIVRFEMDGIEEKDAPTTILEDWYNKELTNRVRIKEKTIQLVHSLLLEGTSYPIPGYSLKKKKQRQFVLDQTTGLPTLDEKSLRVSREVEKVISEGGTVDFVPFNDLYVADDVGTQEEWEECDKIIIRRPTYAELQRKKGTLGYLTENIGPFLLAEKTDDTEKSPGQKQAGVTVTGKEVIECREYHISYPIYQDEEKEENEQVNFEEERIIVTKAVKSGTIIRFLKQTDVIMENTSLPKRVRLFAEPGKSYGTPMYGKLKSIQDGGSDMFNMLINIAYLVMMPWFFYDNKSGMRGEVTLSPGKGVKVDDVNGIKVPSFNINPAQYVEFLQIFMMMWEKLGAISDTQIGRTKDKDTTATEVLTVVQEGNIKHNYQSEQIKEEFLDVLRTLYDLYYERMNPQKQFIVSGKPQSIPYAAMKRGFRFVLNGSTEAANKYIDRREKEDMLGMFGNDPMMNPVKPREELLKSYGILDTSGWINPQVKMVVDIVMQNPEVVQVIGEYMQTKQNVQAAIAGGGGEGTGAVGGVSKVPAGRAGSGGALRQAGMDGRPPIRPGGNGLAVQNNQGAGAVRQNA